MAYIGVQPTAGQYRKLDNISASFNGSTTSFTTSVGGTNVTAGTAQQLIVSLGGVIQQPDTDYTVSTNTITFTTAPTSGLDFFAILMGDALNTVTPSDGSVTTSKLAGSLSVGLADGTVSAPSLFFTGDTNCGLYSPSDDQLAVTTNGVERVEWGTSEVVFNDGGANYDFRVEGDTNANLLFVDASADAVGIGTSSPAERLHLSGTSSWVRLDATAAGGGNFMLGSSEIGGSRAFSIYDVSGSAYRLSINSSGNVGIGTTSPGAIFQTRVAADKNIAFNLDANSVARITCFNDAVSAASSLGINGADLRFQVNNNEAMRLDSSSRLLLGTSNVPTFRIGGQDRTDNTHVITKSGTDLGVAFSVVQWAGNTASTWGNDVVFAKSFNGTVGTHAIGSNGDLVSRFSFSASDGTRFVPAASIETYIDAAPGSLDMPGRLVFSTTADGASSPTERMRINNSGIIYGFSSDLGLWQAVSAAAGTTQAIFRGSYSGSSPGTGTTSYYVWSNGNVQNTNGSFTAISDQKLKENIVDANSQWSDLKSIKIRNWNYKEETGHETHRQIGPIAQELETVCPGLVFETPDRDEDGNETGEVTKGVNQSVLYMKAVKALQEAMERIEQLEVEMAEVKAQLS